MTVATQRGKQSRRNKTRDSVLDPVCVVGMTRQSLESSESPDLIHGLLLAVVVAVAATCPWASLELRKVGTMLQS